MNIKDEECEVYNPDIIAFHANGPAHQLDLANDPAHQFDIANAGVLEVNPPQNNNLHLIANGNDSFIGTLVIENNCDITIEGNVRIDQIIVNGNINNIRVGDGVTIGSLTLNLSQCNENVRNLINFLQLSSSMEIIDIGANQTQDHGNLEQEVLGQNDEDPDEVL